MRDVGKTRIIVASARAILERCPPVLLHWWACEYRLKLKSVSQTLVNRTQKLNTPQVLFCFLCSPIIFCIHLENVSAYALPWPLCPGPAVRKVLHFPPPLPKKIFLMAHPHPSCTYGQLQQEFALRSFYFSNRTSVLNPKFLWGQSRLFVPNSFGHPISLNVGKNSASSSTLPMHRNPLHKEGQTFMPFHNSPMFNCVLAPIRMWQSDQTARKT